MSEPVLAAGYVPLVLVDISEPRDGDLRVIVLEGGAAGQVHSPDLGRKVTEVLPIPGRLAIEVYWEKYLLYTVTNESYALPDQEVGVPPRMLCRRDSPRFLAYVEASTWARSDDLGEVQHWGLFCEWHVIDVATRHPPTSRRIPLQPNWLSRPRGGLYFNNPPSNP